jgi:hypothetical protein
MYSKFVVVENITSNVGLVVEYDPATVETRVRFPDVAKVFPFVCIAHGASLGSLFLVSLRLGILATAIACALCVVWLSARVQSLFCAVRTRPVLGSTSNYEGLGGAVRQTRSLLCTTSPDATRAPQPRHLRHSDGAAATTATSSPQRLLSSLLTSRAHRHHRWLLLPPALPIELLYERVA